MLIGVERCVYSRQAKVSEHEASTDVSDERNATLNLRTTVFRKHYLGSPASMPKDCRTKVQRSVTFIAHIR